MAFSSPVLWGLARGRSKIRNDNPDKETEIFILFSPFLYWIKIRNDNPDKETEMGVGGIIKFATLEIRNDNPDKETEIIVPTFDFDTLSRSIRNDNPDKGTEIRN